LCQHFFASFTDLHNAFIKPVISAKNAERTVFCIHIVASFTYFIIKRKPFYVQKHSFSFAIHDILNIYMSKAEKVEGIVNQKITADLVLDMYEKYKREKNKDKKEEILLKVKLLAKNLNHYLVMPKDFDKYYN